MTFAVIEVLVLRAVIAFTIVLVLVLRTVAALVIVLIFFLYYKLLIDMAAFIVVKFADICILRPIEVKTSSPNYLYLAMD